jgi:hypothetical protein
MLGLAERLNNAWNEGYTREDVSKLRFLDEYSHEELQRAYANQFMTCRINQSELSLIEGILEARFISVPSEEEILDSDAAAG